jgi:hypothetical protein
VLFVLRLKVARVLFSVGLWIEGDYRVETSQHGERRFYREVPATWQVDGSEW